MNRRKHMKWMRAKNEDRMDTLPCLREQNKVANTGRYGIEKLSPLLPEMQTGGIDRSKGLTDNSD